MDVIQIMERTPSIMLITYVGVVLGGAYFFCVSIPKSIRTKYYPTASGRITASEVGSQSLDVSHSAGERIRTYSIDIEYKYDVDEKRYTAKKRKWHEAQTSFSAYHDSRARRYPKGKQVTVYYNPKNPSQAVLEPGLGLGTFIGVIMVVSSIGLLTLLIFYGAYT